MRDARPWTYAALFGTLWGALELTIGTALHLAGVPLYGVLMSLIALVCLVTLRRLQPRFGVCALAGAVAIFLKIFALGGLRPGPMVGIGLAALLVELGFAICGSRALGAVVAGVLVTVAAPAQMLRPSDRTASSRTSIRPVFSTGTDRVLIISPASKPSSSCAIRPCQPRQTASQAAITCGHPQARNRRACMRPSAQVADSRIRMPWSSSSTTLPPSRSPQCCGLVKYERTIAL